LSTLVTLQHVEDDWIEKGQKLGLPEYSREKTLAIYVAYSFLIMASRSQPRNTTFGRTLLDEL
jgi:hypothetical protein